MALETLYTQNPVDGNALTTCDPRTPCVPPSPPPQTRFVQYGGSLNPDWDLDDYLRPQLPERLVDVVSTRLEVEVRATMLHVDVVERGNIITFLASFEGDPDEVNFAYLLPASERPIVDPGFGHEGSQIKRLSKWTYLFQLDTTDFAGGILRWHFWSKGEHQASDFGEMQIPARPAQLL